MTSDNRIRLPAPTIDFENDVGITGQDHDSYPSAGQQPRYDWMRMFLIGLLSNQSSESEPTQYREGTIWFDLNTNTLKIRNASEWQDISSAVSLSATETLKSWFEATGSNITAYGLERVFHGQCTSDNTTTISIPESLRSSITATSRSFVFINGIMMRPIDTLIESPVIRLLNDEVLNEGDKFTVSIREIPEASFISTAVSVP
jgi:hypothetical protein